MDFEVKGSCRQTHLLCDGTIPVIYGMRMRTNIKAKTKTFPLKLFM